MVAWISIGVLVVVGIVEDAIDVVVVLVALDVMVPVLVVVGEVVVLV